MQLLFNFGNKLIFIVIVIVIIYIVGFQIPKEILVLLKYGPGHHGVVWPYRRHENTK